VFTVMVAPEVVLWARAGRAAAPRSITSKRLAAIAAEARSALLDGWFVAVAIASFPFVVAVAALSVEEILAAVWKGHIVRTTY